MAAPYILTSRSCFRRARRFAGWCSAVASRPSSFRSCWPEGLGDAALLILVSPELATGIAGLQCSCRSRCWRTFPWAVAKGLDQLDAPCPWPMVAAGHYAWSPALSRLLSACYVGFRVWSVPDVGPIAKPAAWIGAAVALPSSDPNAADLYREASSRLFGFVESSEFLSWNKASLELIRRAAALSDCWFAEISG